MKEKINYLKISGLFQKVEHMINWNTRRRKNSEENLFEVIITEIIPTLTDTKLREHPAGY